MTLFIHHTKALSVVNLLNNKECLLGQVGPINAETEKIKRGENCRKNVLLLSVTEISQGFCKVISISANVAI